MPKTAKEAVDYTDNPLKFQGLCRDCVMEMQDATRCSAVEGRISPTGHCDLFVRKRDKK